MSGAKIAKKYENPIDNFIVHQLCEPVSETLYKYKITPNIITIIGFIFAIFGLIGLYHYKIYHFMIFNVLAYYCDCLDGFMARKYKQTTKFGDYLDHITDILQVLGIIYVLFTRYKLIKFPKLIGVSMIMAILLFIVQGCQEQLMDQLNNSIVLSSFKTMCKKSMKNHINILRLFGAGTTQLFVLIISYYLWSNMKK
jgi:phosphatidylglycerophosphate synthase